MEIDDRIDELVEKAPDEVREAIAFHVVSINQLLSTIEGGAEVVADLQLEIAQNMLEGNA